MADLCFRDESLGAGCGRCSYGVGDGVQVLGLGLGMMDCEEGEEEDGLADEEAGLERGPCGACERKGVHDSALQEWDLSYLFQLFSWGLGFSLCGQRQRVHIYICMHISGCLLDHADAIVGVYTSSAVDVFGRLPHTKFPVLDL